MTIPIFGGGVTLFFVISGFLITFLLLKEIDKTDTVQIKKFYLRRILRIWPIYYLIILLSIGVSILFNREADILNSNLWYYVFFMANIPFLSANGIWIIVHYWSIGVEEQFYLFWPWLVRMSKKNILNIALFVLVCWLLFKYGSWFIMGNKSLIYRFFAVTSFQSMMVGAVGAILYSQSNKIYMFITTHRLTHILTWLFFLVFYFANRYIPAIISNELITIFSLFLIMEQVSSKNKIINLENSFFDFLGKISYGIYVIHPMVIFLLSNLWRKFNPSLNLNLQYLFIYIFVLGITILLAYFSFHYYEKPFLKLKRRFAIVRSESEYKSK